MQILLSHSREKCTKMPKARKGQFYVRLNQKTESRILGLIEKGMYTTISNRERGISKQSLYTTCN